MNQQLVAVVAALTQWWHFDSEYAETVVEIGAEAIPLNRLFQIAVAGGDDAGLGVARASLADPIVFAIFKYS
ncbi:hypothetical protein QQ73_08985 [Candidatus Endoriftia persephone str. Guaymas]|nr:hypothetical protein [Candidatus Endoriftia persephone str. Guaymas]